MKVNFFEEDYSYQSLKKGRIRDIIKIIADEEKVVFRSINFIFCSDPYLKDLNTRFLNCNYFTDTITFHDSSDGLLHGDIYISVERVFENAIAYHQKSEDEMNRVIIHSVLHLCGYDDGDEISKGIMTEKENYYLAKINK